MGALTALVYWLHLVALALWIGGLAVVLAVLPSGRRTHPDDVPLLESARRRARSVLWWALVTLIVTLAAEVILRTLARDGGDLANFTPSLRSILFGSRYGEASVARWLLVVVSLWAVDAIGRAPAGAPARAPRPSRHALGIVAGKPRRRVTLTRAAWLRLCLLFALALLLATAVSGPFGGDVLSATIDALHLGATLLWLGGTIVLAAVVVPFLPLVERARRPMTALTLLDRYSPLALLAVIVLVLTGWWETRHSLPNGLLSGLFDRILGLKMLLYLAMIGVSLWGAMAVRPRLRRQAMRARRDERDERAAAAVAGSLASLRRLLWVNPLLAVVALLLGAVGNAYPERATAAVVTHPQLTARAGAVAITLRVTPGTAGLNTFDLHLTSGGRPFAGADVALAAQSLVMRGMDPPWFVARDLGGGRYRARGVLTMGGRWRLHLSLLQGTTVAAADLALTAAPASRPMSKVAPAPLAASGLGIWQPLGPNVIAHSLVADPADHARLYEGTITGVYRSTDGGQHWAAASTGLFGSSREVWSLTFIPDGSLIAATGDGIYRTTDGAAHWRAAGLGTHSVYTLAAHLAGHVVLLAGGDGGIFRSDDLAVNWHKIYDSGAAAVSSLAWPALRPSLIVAGITPAARPIAISDDGGVTWHTGGRGLPSGPGLMSVAVAPGIRSVYAGSMGLGAYALPGLTGTWQGRNTGLPGLTSGDAHIGSFAFDPLNPAIIYAATPFGVYRSADAGRYWALFGRGLYGDATVITALTLVTGPHPALYAATAAGVYRTPLAVPK